MGLDWIGDVLMSWPAILRLRKAIDCSDVHSSWCERGRIKERKKAQNTAHRTSTAVRVRDECMF
jgi:hypothetical protein